MMLIPCPWCGPRNETEFHYGGEAGVAYPDDPAALSDAEWGRYLYVRANPKGEMHERWCHNAGCRRWFTIHRDTVTHEIRPATLSGTPSPSESPAAAGPLAAGPSAAGPLSAGSLAAVSPQEAS